LIQSLFLYIIKMKGRFILIDQQTYNTAEGI